MGSMMSALPAVIHGALLAAGVVSVTRFVYCRVRGCNKKKLARDLKACRDDVVAFAQDACEEVCECMTGSEGDRSEGTGND